MTDLLTSDHKLELCSDYGWLARGLQLLPGDKSGVELCPHRGACFATCLESAGRGQGLGIQRARGWRSKLWHLDPKGFLGLLTLELEKLVTHAERQGLRPCVRLNVFSDIDWENRAPDLFPAFPDVQFYDYTKSPRRAARLARIGRMPDNYDLTYSWSELADGHFGSTHLRGGGRIAIVERDGDSLPTWMLKHPQVNGDQHDLTFLHDPGSILCLTPKGKLFTNRTKFA